MRHERNESHSAGPLSQRGSVVILVALSLAVLIGFASLAIDMGRFRLVASQLQAASDSGALAGAWQLDDTSSGETQARLKGSEFAQKHWADKGELDDVDPNQDVVPGNFDFKTLTFTAGSSVEPTNAVMVTTYRGANKGTEMEPYLGNVPPLNFPAGDEDRRAVAVGLGPGCGNAFPIAVPECIVKDSGGNLKCDGSTELQLSNDIIDNAGITSLSESQSANVNYIRDLIKNYDPTAPCNSNVDSSIKVQNGNPRQPVGSEIRNSILDKDGDGIMTPVEVCMPIVDPGVPCSQIKFNQKHEVSGYVAFRLDEVILPNDPGQGSNPIFIKGACLEDSDVCGGPAGGGWYGVKGKPRLVQPNAYQ